jgi:hypothetical protein
MLEPCLVTRGGLASKACAELQHPLDPTGGYWRCGALNLIARGLADDESLSRRAI